jgi:hypothetical protein
LITPRLCVTYVSAWLRDRIVWRNYIEAIAESTAEEAVRDVELC